MYEAEVGDDQYGEDPTVRSLEEAYAERVGKQAALFVPSGVMANQLALLTLCPRGSLVVAGRRQHVAIYEHGASAQNAGVQLHLVDDERGALDPEEVSWAIEAEAHHQPKVGLVCVEQTHMPSGGVPLSLESLEAVRRVAEDAGIPIHMDGARLFNAEVATGIGADRFASTATSVMTCLSKGLCAPVGSLLAGSIEFVEAARIERHRLGGAMRQAGVIAAAGLVGLRTMIGRLAEDHRRARTLAEAVASRWPEAGCDPRSVQTNVVVASHPDTDSVLAHLAGEGVLAGTLAPGVLRFVTHNDVDDAGIERAAKAIATAPQPAPGWA